ncbi:MAG: T9SS type A sorting domain-containing protein [Candidatus Cloacimonetes bacterium]|nr:T9SS type A sorting domain-containing protein [Candidatus Cloacimonadota bacterium]
MKITKILTYTLLFLMIPLFLFAKSPSYTFKRLPAQEMQKRYEKLKKLPPEVHQKIYNTHGLSDKFTGLTKDGFEGVDLLVILVDFIPDDDPKTTGNGKFDFGKYDYFEINGVLDSISTIGSPPHDSTFFHQTVKAMQYYYQTASLGELNTFNPLQEKNFHFKIFPHQADTAYQMPQQMSYYWPDTEDFDLKSDRLIQYFKDAITTADTTEFEHTPDIIFSEYNHIMIIHAGSDWQHDVFWDTPCDIPSCYFHLRDDSIAVNDSTFFVKAGGNTSETISQDFYKNNHFIYGFGSINAEFFHEFGHGLGFVDLYNTSNMFPAVGYWDIMDSGGFGSAVLIDTMQTPPDSLVIEAVLPTLPSAWSRTLIWGNEFEASGKFITIDSPSEITVSAAELPDAVHPQFVKIPINNKEYFLIENREVELDNQGAPVIKVDDITGRVPLYPMNPVTELINYEFDYFLPTYDIHLEAETNGGLCIWHIDDYVIFDELVEVDDGWYNRFDANMVNAKSSRRGVKLVEADGIEDLGNPYSYFPYGTCYEPFFKTKPGTWTPSDTNRYHNYKLSPKTRPNSFSNEGINSLLEITNISNYGVEMSFTFQYQTYDEITSYKPAQKFNPAHELIHYKNDIFDTHVLAIASDSLLVFYEEELFGDTSIAFSKPITQPLSLGEFDQKKYVILSLEDSLAFIRYDIMQTPPISSTGIKLDRWITDSPIQISENNIIVPTDLGLRKVRFDEDAPFIVAQENTHIEKIAFDPMINELVALTHGNTVALYDTSLSLLEEFPLGTQIGNYYPIIESLMEDLVHEQRISIQDNSGTIHVLEDGIINQIFDSATYPISNPSNISLGDVNNDGIHDLVFTSDDRIFILQPNGSFLNKTPIMPYDVSYSESVSPIIGQNYLAENISLYLPTSSNWTQAIDNNCAVQDMYSFANGLALASPSISRNESSSMLYLPISDSLVQMYSFIHIDNSPVEVYWNGYKNGPQRTACVTTLSDGSPDSTSTFTILTYPNPAEYGEVRIRIRSNQDAASSIKIYNLAADILFSDEQQITAYINNEYVWPIDNVSSGVYFAMVKVGGKSELVKIGITK